MQFFVTRAHVTHEKLQETIHKFCITSLFAHAENWLFLWRKFFELIQKHKFILNRFFKGSARSFTFALLFHDCAHTIPPLAPQRRLIISSKFPPRSSFNRRQRNTAKYLLLLPHTHPRQAHPYKWAFNNKSKELEQLNNSKRNQRKRARRKEAAECAAGCVSFCRLIFMAGIQPINVRTAFTWGVIKAKKGCIQGYRSVCTQHSANTHTAGEQKSFFSAFCADSAWKESFVAARMIWKYCARSQRRVLDECRRRPGGTSRVWNRSQSHCALLFSLFMPFPFYQKEIWLKSNAGKHHNIF